jgi:N,N-dimethylformamidase beta subunit-like protein
MDVKQGSRIRGYTDRQSVAQGQSLRFHLANLGGTSPTSLPIRIVKLGVREEPVFEAVATAWAHDVSTSRAWENNNWDVGYRLDVGSDWTPGVYAARFGASTDDSADVFFVVRSAAPGTTTPIVVQIPTTTINAYNNWGGASLYGYNSISSPAYAISFNRPQYADAQWPRGYGFSDEWDARIRAFVYWLEAAGYRADFITSNDLHESKDLLQRYRLFISIGHDEYWSRDMRDHFDAHIALGGNAAIFGGNTCQWQTRLEADERTGEAGRRQLCYRIADQDPIQDPTRKTVTWREVGYPENLSFGAGFARGAWRGMGTPMAFKVHRSDHWAFFQTELANGDEFGNDLDENLLGYETNSVDYVYDKRGRPVPTCVDGTPPNYDILALAELPDWQIPGNAAMGILTNPGSGGTVFNAATTDWARGLEACVREGDCFRTITAKVTRNVIEHLIKVE